MSDRPLIALIPDHEKGKGKKGLLRRPTYLITEFYIKAVEKAGGLPMLLPYLESRADLHRLLRRVQGLVLIGGDFDIPPDYYGHRPSPKLGVVKHRRSDFEYAALEGALKRKLPVLGICGGMQLLNVVFGGTLIQDIRSERDSSLRHETHPSGKVNFHGVSVLPGTLLAKLTRRLKLRCNSSHHQAVLDLGRNLRVSARAEDGVVEAIEHPDFPFALGVQWHPEKLIAQKPHLAIFKGLVDRARAIL